MDGSGIQWMPDRAHPANSIAILWHHDCSNQRESRVERVNHDSQSESATASLKMIVDSVDAIARDAASKMDCELLDRVPEAFPGTAQFS
jgi:hypothetical protein